VAAPGRLAHTALDTYASEGLWLTDDLGKLVAEAAELVA
jgi:hypothetical protein